MEEGERDFESSIGTLKVKQEIDEDFHLDVTPRIEVLGDKLELDGTTDGSIDGAADGSINGTDGPNGWEQLPTHVTTDSGEVLRLGPQLFRNINQPSLIYSAEQLAQSENMSDILFQNPMDTPIQLKTSGKLMWNHEMVMLLLTSLTPYATELHIPVKKREIFKKIVPAFHQQGYLMMTSETLLKKWHNILVTFRRAKIKKDKTGEESSWLYYNKIEELTAKSETFPAEEQESESSLRSSSPLQYPFPTHLGSLSTSPPPHSILTPSSSPYDAPALSPSSISSENPAKRSRIDGFELLDSSQETVEHGSKSRHTWTHEMVVLLLKCLTPHQAELHITIRKKEIFKKLVQQFNSRGYPMSFDDILKKWHNLLVTFRRAKIKKLRTGEETNWVYYNKIDQLTVRSEAYLGQDMEADQTFAHSPSPAQPHSFTASTTNPSSIPPTNSVHTPQMPSDNPHKRGRVEVLQELSSSGQETVEVLRSINQNLSNINNTLASGFKRLCDILEKRNK